MPGIEFWMRLGAWGADMSSAEFERFIDQCLALGLATSRMVPAVERVDRR